MKAKETPCSKCGGMPKIHGGDYLDVEGPWNVACIECGRESICWAYPREAWGQWKVDNQKMRLKMEEG